MVLSHSIIIHTLKKYLCDAITITQLTYSVVGLSSSHHGKYLRVQSSNNIMSSLLSSLPALHMPDSPPPAINSHCSNTKGTPKTRCYSYTKTRKHNTPWYQANLRSDNIHIHTLCGPSPSHCYGTKAI